MAAVLAFDSQVAASGNVQHTGVKRLWNSRMRAASLEPSAALSLSTPRCSAAPSVSSASGLTVTPSSREPSAAPPGHCGEEKRSSSMPRDILADSPGPRPPPLKVRRGVNRSHSSSHLRAEGRGGAEGDLSPTHHILPPRLPSTKLTVVFDLDETLVSNRHSSEAIPRPYYHAVLQGLSQKPEVEVVLWTASTKEVVNQVLSSLEDEESSSCFQHVIPRDKKWFTEPTHTKDLRLLGRPMDRIIIVENSPNCCKLNPQNAILVDDYHGQEEDAALVNVYYMIEAVIQLINDGYSVSTSLRTLAKEQLLCDWFQMDLPDIWKSAPLWSFAPEKIPAFGKFIKAKTSYNIS